MKRNYKWSEHLSMANNYEENMLLCDGAESNYSHREDADSLFANALRTNSSIIVADAISVDGGHGNAKQTETKTIYSSVDDSTSSDFSSVHNLVRSTVVAPCYSSSKNNERIIVELPSLMVRPFKVVRGTFQVSGF